MKARSELTAAELVELYESLDRRLSAIGIETQPAVATSILDLTQDPDAGMQDYAKIIKNDAGLTGRLIKLANSAFFAQSKPVTTIDRACVLLGMARVRSIALGFYLSRAASSDTGAVISREVWGQSVFRACLAAEIAKSVVPSHASEAFVIGLMLDAGVPLVHTLLGTEFASLYEQGYPPTKSFNIEFAQHQLTHVDVISTLVRWWKFPDLLCKPIVWHHTPPPTDCGGSDPLQLLYRVAYYTGAVALTADGTPSQRVPMASTASTHLGLDSGTLEGVVARAITEYELVLALFAEVADPVAGVDLATRVHSQLIGSLDAQMEGDLAAVTRPGPREFKLGGYVVLLRPEDEGQGSAFSYDTSGEPLSTYRFLFGSETAESLRTALGLEAEDSDQSEAVGEYLRKLAA
jgi:HD-like signal output (HDOD) protein